MRSVRAAVVVGVLVGLVAATGGPSAAEELSIPYSCDASGGTIEVGVLSAPIDVVTSATPEPADAFDVVTYTADLAMPDISPQPVAVNFNFFRVTFDVPPGFRAVQAKVQDPPSATANPALAEIGVAVDGDQVVVDVPAAPSTSRRFHFGTDGNFTYPFNTATQSGGTAVVLPRIKIKAMVTYAGRSNVLEWPAPTVDTETGFAGIGDLPCTPDDPGAAIFATATTAAVDIPLNPYTDVPNGLDPAVSWARHVKVFKPSGTRFSPSTQITRADAVVALWNLVDRPVVGTGNPFTDVPANASYRSAVNWAVSEGVVTDTGNHRFKPTSTLSRGTLTQFAFRTVHAQDGSPWPPFAYTDVPAGAPYTEALRWADANGIVNESSGGTKVKPTLAATRGDLARFLFNTASNDWFRSLPTTVLVGPA